MKCPDLLFCCTWAGILLCETKLSGLFIFQVIYLCRKKLVRMALKNLITIVTVCRAVLYL